MHSYQIVSNANKSNLCNNKGLSCHIKSLEMENTYRECCIESEQRRVRRRDRDRCLPFVGLSGFISVFVFSC